MRLPDLRGLYAITPDEGQLPRLVALVEAALSGGARVIQYRNKGATPEVKRTQATRLVHLCHLADARLIVNDDLAMALDIGADGVHLGDEDVLQLPLSAARAALGPGRILGVSCYGDPARGDHAAASGADYLAFGSVFASPTKPAAKRVSLDVLGTARRRCGKPIVAIGGITLDNAAMAIAAGADMVAVISDLFDAPDVADRARQFEQLFH